MIGEVSILLCDRMDDLLDQLSVDLSRVHDRYIGPCPVHGGDNHEALNLYPEGDKFYGWWECYTRGCHEYFPKYSAVGFLRGVLSHQQHGWEQPGDGTVSHRDAMDYALRFLGSEIDQITVDQERDECRRFIRDVQSLTEQATGAVPLCTREEFRRCVQVPAPYFLERGYSRLVLDEYDVGYCKNRRSEMCSRVVVPVYDVNYRMVIGCVGRSIHDACPSCGLHHYHTYPCPDPRENLGRFSKWTCSKKFTDKHHLYNYWKAKTHIDASRCMVIVEGAADVWRLEEAGIHNAVALFGADLSGQQKRLIDGCNGTIVALTDNDAAGERAAAIIADKCGDDFHVFRLCPPAGFKDVGEMPVQRVKESILPFIRSKMGGG